MDLRNFCDAMRSCGVRRVSFGSRDAGAGSFTGFSEDEPIGFALTEIELFDTIPAPPPEDDPLPPTQPDELKTEAQCIATGCAESSGWMGTRYCRAHGLATAGVKS